MDLLLPEIVFEKQEGNLCAQHALNALLQGDYYTAVDLAEIAQTLDQKVSLISGRNESGDHHDESGYFSLEVIQQALSVWGLSLAPWRSQDASAARQNPEKQHAYICHMHQHWFALRRFATFWYDLNSMHGAPKRLGATYLGMLLQQYEQEGYMVFVVVGSLPICKADRHALTLPPMDSNVPVSTFSGVGHRLGSSHSNTEVVPRAATSEEEKARRVEEIRRKRLEYFERNKSA